MIRSIRSIRLARKTVREMGCDTCPILPGRPGPLEPFSAKCVPEDGWGSIREYFARAYLWDCGKLGMQSASRRPAAVEEAADLAVGKLWTTRPEQWFAMGIGWGDVWRAVVAVRGLMRKSFWRDRTSATGHGRRGSRRYRPYTASMSLRTEDPARLVAAADAAAARGLWGADANKRGPRKVHLRKIGTRVALNAIVGEPVREIVVGPIAVSGGIAEAPNDGRMRYTVVRETEFEYFPGRWVYSIGKVGEPAPRRWVADCDTETDVEQDWRWKMVPARTIREEYQKTFVAEAVDCGTERPRLAARPEPIRPNPWTAEELANLTTHRPAASAGWTRWIPEGPDGQPMQSLARHYVRLRG